MNRHLAALPAVPLMLLLAACGSVQESAQTAASDAATKVASSAANQVKSQVCTIVQDGLVSVQEKALLGGLVSASKTAGVPAEITTPLDQIAESADQAPTESVTALREACSQ
ncbi:hypothetical protein J7E83_20660 [Arthrobacter sp. ISL-48]|uniref:hypothetical protein n=1 Tax=Arthrobacter sp. ISL-48 TaxID=2819110 RepID=UPI001BEBE071|nr:hypothetical protein [Arthrobacter sp. ISL-48]MBT2534494.1 hypothetical protein [Arthrobacter sp. ISL-48]